MSVCVRAFGSSVLDPVARFKGWSANLFLNLAWHSEWEIASALAKVVGLFEETVANLREELSQIIAKSRLRHVIEAEQFMSVIDSQSLQPLYVGRGE